MSLNEIYDDPLDRSVKTWQNYRFNNLNIKKNFNIDTTGAAPGDIYQLDGSLEGTWVPFSGTNTLPLGYAYASTSLTSVPIGSRIKLPLSSFVSSADFTLVNGGANFVDDYSSALVCLKITSVPTATSMPVFTLVKESGGVEHLIGSMSPYRGSIGSSNPFTSCSMYIPLEAVANDKIYVYAQLTTTSITSCQIVNTEFSFNVIKLL